MNKKEIASTIGVTSDTLRNWSKNRPYLYKIVMKHFDGEKGSNNISVVGSNNTLQDIKINGRDVSSELCDALHKLPEKVREKYYHEIKLELLKSELD